MGPCYGTLNLIFLFIRLYDVHSEEAYFQRSKEKPSSELRAATTLSLQSALAENAKNVKKSGQAMNKDGKKDLGASAGKLNYLALAGSATCPPCNNKPLATKNGERMQKSGNVCEGSTVGALTPSLSERASGAKALRP